MSKSSLIIESHQIHFNHQLSRKSIITAPRTFAKTRDFDVFTMLFKLYSLEPLFALTSLMSFIEADDEKQQTYAQPFHHDNLPWSNVGIA